MARFIAIDYGLERTGLAISDVDEKFVFPLTTLHLSHFGSRKALLDALCQIIRDEQAQNLVLGLPLYENGAENLSCRRVHNLVPRLKRRLDLPIFLMPELLSSHEALQDLRDSGLKGRKIKAALDQQAACRILESFLAQPEQGRRPA